jgi:hypothetical protein
LRHDSPPLLLMLLSTVSIQLKLDPWGRPSRRWVRICYDILRHSNSKFVTSVCPPLRPRNVAGCFCCISLSAEAAHVELPYLCGNFSVTAVLRVSRRGLCRRFVSSWSVRELQLFGSRRVTPLSSVLTPFGYSINKFPALVGYPGFSARFTGANHWSFS